jgi:universal stress protein A
VTAFKRILVPHDFSDDASAALDFAIELAKQLGGELHLVHAYRLPIEVFSPYGVAIPDSVMPELRKGAELRLKELAARVEAAGLTARVHLREGAPAEVIAESARELGADLIVMGTRGRTGLAHVVLGSVAERTVRSSPCPVLTLRS